MKRLIIGIVAIALVIGIYLFMKRDQYSVVDESEVRFEIDDINAVTKVIMENKLGEKVVLEQKDNSWIVNEEYPAFQPLIDRLLNETLSKIRIKGPVPGPAQENVIRAMVVDAIHVRVYAGTKLMKDYYVGGSTPDELGTYMHLAGASKPYVVHTPGTEGVLTPMYHLVAQDWYSKSIFDFKPEEIQSIEILNRTEPEESFLLSRKDDRFTISPKVAGEPIDQSRARSYFSLFKFKNLEGYANYLLKSTADSILTSIPIMEVTVNPMNGKSIKLKVYPKGNEENKTLVDNKGNLLAYDPERYFASFTGFSKIVTIQDYTFGKILTKRSEFYP